MRTKELIEENNRKRERLNEENEAYYNGLLLYIRTSFNRSERETEEILMEVLDHLLEAQAAGRTAEDVFGSDPKAYAQEIVGELPTALPKEMVKTLAVMGLIFFGMFSFASGLLSTLLSYGFGIGEPMYSFRLGSLAVGAAGSILAVALLVYGILGYIRWSAFRPVSRWKEFAISFLGGGAAVGLLLAGLYFLPSFGASFALPVYWLIPIGAALYGIGHWLQKK